MNSIGKNHILVSIRVRPPLKNEIEKNDNFLNCIEYDDCNDSIIKVFDQSSNDFKRFAFDKVFNSNTTQEMLYLQTTKFMVTDFIKGYNSSLFAYGQTSTGKTFSLFGNKDTPGVLFFALKDIFLQLETVENSVLKMKCIEVYNNDVRDLLNGGGRRNSTGNGKFNNSNFNNGNSDNINIYIDNATGSVQMTNVTEVLCEDFQQTYLTITKAYTDRVISSTEYNHRSSRSHMIVQLHLQYGKTQRRWAKFNFVDLAGSEKLSNDMEYSKERRKEAIMINNSLSVLNKVVLMLGSPVASRHVPFRESKLTRILQDSVGGNTRTTFLITLTPAMRGSRENINSLRFAENLKKIKVKASINVESDNSKDNSVEIEHLKRHIADLEKENAKLKQSKQIVKIFEQLPIIFKDSHNNLVTSTLDSLVRNPAVVPNSAMDLLSKCKGLYQQNQLLSTEIHDLQSELNNYTDQTRSFKQRLTTQVINELDPHFNFDETQPDQHVTRIVSDLVEHHIDDLITSLRFDENSIVSLQKTLTDTQPYHQSPHPHSHPHSHSHSHSPSPSMTTLGSKGFIKYQRPKSATISNTNKSFTRLERSRSLSLSKSNTALNSNLGSYELLPPASASSSQSANGFRRSITPISVNLEKDLLYQQQVDDELEKKYEDFNYTVEDDLIPYEQNHQKKKLEKKLNAKTDKVNENEIDPEFLKYLAKELENGSLFAM
eukprot:TRINITY_DN3333_c0_g1_i1.p1 TRINITY_DN3333_c0_g1~~TRINITY_DN3333_c0_g1_i1.p1  ORF type:complete len:714 (+),score=162.94 TRINITY_DN3333_c0_g1_i1:45-2186(+)